MEVSAIPGGAPSSVFYISINILAVSRAWFV
jgi:hypothetical protein